MQTWSSRAAHLVPVAALFLVCGFMTVGGACGRYSGEQNSPVDAAATDAWMARDTGFVDAALDAGVSPDSGGAFLVWAGGRRYQSDAGGDYPFSREVWQTKVLADGELEPWVRAPDLPIPSQGGGVVAQGRYVYVAQGPNGAAANLAIYEMVDGRLKSIPSTSVLPNGVRSPCLAVAGDKLFALAEYGDFVAYATVNGPTVGGWFPIATKFNAYTPQLVATPFGLVSGSDLSYARFVVDTVNDRVTTSTLGSALVSSTASGVIVAPIVFESGRVYQAGGFNGAVNPRVFVSSPLSADGGLTWTAGEALESPRKNHSAAIVNNVLYAVGGVDESNIALAHISRSDLSVSSGGLPGPAVRTKEDFPAGLIGSCRLAVVRP
jgi:Kelch motif